METEFNMAYRISNPYQVSNTGFVIVLRTKYWISYIHCHIAYSILNIDSDADIEKEIYLSHINIKSMLDLDRKITLI